MFKMNFKGDATIFLRRDKALNKGKKKKRNVNDNDVYFSNLLSCRRDGKEKKKRRIKELIVTRNS